MTLRWGYDQLADLHDRDLDYVVGKMVFGQHKDRKNYITPNFSQSWHDFGLLLAKMLQHGFVPDVTRALGPKVNFGWNRINVIDGRNRWSYTGDFNPRTASIAAVLTCQECVIWPNHRKA